MIALVHSSLGAAIGWTLFHSLWEGALVAMLLAIALRVLRSSRTRYAMACLSMLAVLAGFGYTFVHPMPAGPDIVTTINGPSHAVFDRSQHQPRPPARFHAAQILPWLTPFWIAGVVLFHLHTVASWMAAQRLRRRGVCHAPDRWQQHLTQLRDRVRLSTPVTLLESSLANVPVAIGYLRPVILVPVGMLTGMPAQQIQAILLHELAHIRRRDYLVNLMQTVVEGFLFYHPAVWWISHVIRTERENCCDDLVVALSGDAHEYAAALTALEQSRWAEHDAALAATGGNLMKRIRRLLYPLEAPRTVLSPVLSASILTLTAALVLTAWQDKPQDNPKPTAYQMWLNEDVAYIVDDRERAAFTSLTTDDERGEFIRQFWDRRNPHPGAPENEFKQEHYRRIAWANEHYPGDGLVGWKSDRGRIYILYGPPDEIESHPRGDYQGGQVWTPPFEQWLYHHISGVGDNIIMEFVDKNRTGQFYMTSDPNPSGRFISH